MPRIELPRALVYCTGVTCGVLAAMAVQIMLARKGIELAAVWRNLISAQSLQLRSAGAWWLMAGSAFLTSAVIVGALSRLPWPWHRFRLPRWIVAAALVYALAEAGHIAAASGDTGGGAHAAVTLATLIAAGLMSLFGAYFAVKR